MPHLLRSSTRLGRFPRAMCPPTSANRCPAGHRDRLPARLVPERASGLGAGGARGKNCAAYSRRERCPRI
eukprot:scaffold38354_cov75-Phaeocystis_antarctica.AAC.1